MSDDQALHTGTELVKPLPVGFPCCRPARGNSSSKMLHCSALRCGPSLTRSVPYVAAPTRQLPDGAIVTIADHNES